MSDCHGCGNNGMCTINLECCGLETDLLILGRAELRLLESSIQEKQMFIQKG